MLSLRAATLVRRTPIVARSFASSARVQSGGSHMSSNDPEVLEREKRRSLHEKHDDSAAPHKEHAPGWIEDLASVSEAHVKADRANTGTPEDLQKATTEYIKKRHPEGVTEKVVETVSSAMHKAADKVHELAPGVEKDRVQGSKKH